MHDDFFLFVTTLFLTAGDTDAVPEITHTAALLIA